MSRALLAIGCREYDDRARLPYLDGADVDAEGVYRTLVEDTGHYDASFSRRLISPTLEEVNAALDDLLSLPNDVDVVSFFFAGHGVAHRGLYYLCIRDTMAAKPSTTALQMGKLLAVLADAQVRQVNVVMDACQSGGAMLDLANLLKPENLAGPQSPNVSFLAASAPDQASYGDSSGGVATTALMTYLSGAKELRRDRPFLDLVELGRRVSEDVGDRVQRPVSWGVNLFGEDEFAWNPFYEVPSAGRPPLPVTLAPASAAGSKVRDYSDALWQHYQSLPTDPDYGSLAELLRAACEELEEEGASSAAFMRGVAGSLRSRAEVSNDFLAPSDVLACCAMALLPLVGESGPAAVVTELLAEKRVVDATLREELTERIRSDRFDLLNKELVLADFFLLPIRVSRILGWIASGILTDGFFGRLDADVRQGYTDLARLVAQTYRGSLVAMSDAQAPHVYMFAAAHEAFEEEDLAREVLSAYFENLAGVGGFVARGDAEPREALRYLLGRMAGQPGADHSVVANPVQFLSALLLPGAPLGLEATWNRRLVDLDGRYMGVFVPDDHREFGMVEMPSGTNRQPRMGHGFWTVQHVANWFDVTVRPTVSDDEFLRIPEAKALGVLASYLLPDRLPLYLQR